MVILAPIGRYDAYIEFLEDFEELSHLAKEKDIIINVFYSYLGKNVDIGSVYPNGKFYPTTFYDDNPVIIKSRKEYFDEH